MSNIDNNYDGVNLELTGIIPTNRSTYMEKAQDYIQSQSPTVDIGRKIEIDINGEPQVWEVVNVGETDISNGKISCSAPLIQCILGRREGERIKNKIVNTDTDITIKSVW